MAKSDARFEYRAKLNRDVHELGEPFGFTTAPGMLNPVFADVATPGDTYYINHDLEYLRTLPLQSPAMIDVKVHLESFFVPFQMIYQPIEQTLYSMLNPQSSMFNRNSFQNNKFPLCPYDLYVSDMMSNYSQKHSSRHTDAFRMADLLGLNADNFAWDSNNQSRFRYNPRFFPWQLLAYNTIWNYYYRLDDKSNFRQSGNYDSSYSETDYGAFSDEFMDIRQRPWDFDYFTSMYRSPIVSDASMQKVFAFGSSGEQNPLVGSKSISIKGDGFNSNTNAETKAFSALLGNTYNDVGSIQALSTASIRQMFANEKLSMITGRARKTYDAQILAHFGVEVPHDPKHDISVIGTDTYMLHVGEVTSLASTEQVGLGDLAGKGWTSGKGNKQHKFTCPCHGVVMTIFSVEPLKRYYGGFDRINCMVDAFDIPTPEFDRLGNMPMYRFEAGELAGEGTITATDIIGWKERYYWNKRRHPKVTLAFQNGTLNQGVNSYGSYMITSAPFGAYTGTNNNTARPDLESRFYIDRNCMDGLMYQPFVDQWQNGIEGEETSENWNKTPWLAYARDPFIIDLNMKIKKVSWMSKDGEPVYNF